MNFTELILFFNHKLIALTYLVFQIVKTTIFLVLFLVSFVNEQKSGDSGYSSAVDVVINAWFWLSIGLYVCPFFFPSSGAPDLQPPFWTLKS